MAGLKTLIQKLVGIGADLSTRRTLKSALKILGIRPDNIDKFYCELKNSINEEVFRELSAKEKVVFIPQCLRNSTKCQAKLREFGFECVGCCGCQAMKIKVLAERLGYDVFIVPGASMVLETIRKLKPKAVFGISCLKEMVMAFEEIKLPARAVELSRAGCRDTIVNLQEVFNVLEGVD